MADVGITRIMITDHVNGRGAWRFAESQKRWTAANHLYREIFASLNMPLLQGEDIKACSMDEFIAGYDYVLGIDVILGFESGMEATLQEKFLFTRYKTVTVEYMQDWRTGEQGDWFTMRANYYFVGYDRLNALSFQDWILLNWPATQQATAQGLIPWALNRNGPQDGARASFRYANFDSFPSQCVIACNEPLQTFFTAPSKATTTNFI